MGNLQEWEQIVSRNTDLQKEIIKSQEAIASELERILNLASANGIELSLSDILSSPEMSSDNELEAAVGGVDGCGLARGGVNIACGIGAIFSLGASVAASAVGNGAAIAASN